jgi:hypothetical protein
MMNPTKTSTESIEVRLLQALLSLETWVTATILADHIAMRSPYVVEETLNILASKGHVTKRYFTPQQPVWSISGSGKVWLTALGKDMPRPMSATICHVEEPTIASVAYICLDEDELDNWWDGLDVEAKSDAFIGYSLRAQGQDDSHVYCPGLDLDDSIPVRGTIGRDASQKSADQAASQAVRS